MHNFEERKLIFMKFAAMMNMMMCMCMRHMCMFRAALRSDMTSGLILAV